MHTPSLLFLEQGTVGGDLLVQLHADVHELLIVLYLLLIVGPQIA